MASLNTDVKLRLFAPKGIAFIFVYMESLLYLFTWNCICHFTACSPTLERSFWHSSHPFSFEPPWTICYYQQTWSPNHWPMALYCSLEGSHGESFHRVNSPFAPTLCFLFPTWILIHKRTSPLILWLLSLLRRTLVRDFIWARSKRGIFGYI